MMSSKTIDSAPRRRGRPRGYDGHEALDMAMRLFWAEGYEGASIDQLSRSMNMSRASLYQQFRDKEGLFLAAVGHYVETRITTLVHALGPRGSLREDLLDFFAAVVNLATSDPATPGCLISCVLADAAGGNPKFRDELGRRFAALEARVADRLSSADGRAGDPRSTELCAMLLAAVARGIMLKARAGTDRDTLLAVGATAVDMIAPPPLH